MWKRGAAYIGSLCVLMACDGSAVPDGGPQPVLPERVANVKRALDTALFALLPFDRDRLRLPR